MKYEIQLILQVAARTETGVRRRTQAMSRSCSKRKSRFSSLWGLDTTSKKKTKAHPSINQVSWPLSSLAARLLSKHRLPQITAERPSLQVFADGEELIKKPVDGIYVDPAKEHAVRTSAVDVFDKVV